MTEKRTVRDDVRDDIAAVLNEPARPDRPRRGNALIARWLRARVAEAHDDVLHAQDREQHATPGTWAATAARVTLEKLRYHRDQLASWADRLERDKDTKETPR